MFKLFKRDKRVQALGVLSVFALLSFVLGLYLVLAHDVKTRASWYVFPGSFYYSQSKSQGFEGPAAEAFLRKAKDQHLKAIAMNPGDYRLWRNLARILAQSEPARSAEAAQISVMLHDQILTDRE